MGKVLNSKYKLQLLPANTYLEAALLWHMLWVELTTICRTKPKKRYEQWDVMACHSPVDHILTKRNWRKVRNNEIKRKEDRNRDYCKGQGPLVPTEISYNLENYKSAV
jgi:hypothetical protein